jgi:hypothetical protein
MIGVRKNGTEPSRTYSPNSQIANAPIDSTIIQSTITRQSPIAHSVIRHCLPPRPESC